MLSKIFYFKSITGYITVFNNSILSLRGHIGNWIIIANTQNYSSQTYEINDDKSLRLNDICQR